MSQIKYQLEVKSELADCDYDEYGMHFTVELTRDKRVSELCLPIWLPEGTYIPGSIIAGEGGIAPIEGTYSASYVRQAHLVAVQNGEEIYADLEEILLDCSFRRMVRPGDYRTNMVFNTFSQDIYTDRDDNESPMIYHEQRVPRETVKAYVTPLRILDIKTF